MNFRKILALLLLLFTCSFHAQENINDKKEQIRALKVAFLTTELDLSSQESEKFWPLYNAYDNKQFEIRHEKMKAYKSKFSDDALSKMNERDAAMLLSQMEASEEELFLLRKKFSKSLRSILPAIKIIKLKKAEDDFNRKLLQQYGDRGKRRDK
ncbi:sensor of ECF-type sigma factor [Flavobacterium sufflavum]|uniref:Sensor of ECF-type sigma factor n=1 Tax=Flavobacterium sufflavum TaxID=1921138 RepID=A0A437KXY6_9FLAO|nr:sensor of ECF-type sigma factor [Flavobacterium sufflavum]RVT77450.1 sensor of ECF-type sigma factor [Flavobacterium sufflavum]